VHKRRTARPIDGVSLCRAWLLLANDSEPPVLPKDSESSALLEILSPTCVLDLIPPLRSYYQRFGSSSVSCLDYGYIVI
jgi:hypothetical protein